FSGGDSEVSVDNFTLSGGTFVAPSTFLTVLASVGSSRTIFTFSGGTFTHSSGTLRFRTIPYNGNTVNLTISLANALTVNNLIYEAGAQAREYDSDRAWTLSGTAAKFIVEGDFTIRRATGFTLATAQTSRPIANGGTIDLKGNLNINTGAYGGSTLVKFNSTGNQTYSYTGGTSPSIEIDKTAGSVSAAAGTTELEMRAFTLTQGTFNAPTGNLTVFPITISAATVFTYTAGTFNHSSGTLRFRNVGIWAPGGAVTYSISIASALTVNNLTYEAGTSTAYGDTDRHLTLVGADPRFIVLGEFLMRRVPGFALGTGGQTARPVADSGTIELRGTLNIGTGAYGGTTVLKFNGSGDQTYTYTDGIAPHIEIDKTTGSVSAAAGTTDLQARTFTHTQ
ncbi:MAG: hypothetical protein ACK5GN_08650, partial [Pseudomonadota bacterium]